MYTLKLYPNVYGVWNLVLLSFKGLAHICIMLYYICYFLFFRKSIDEGFIHIYKQTVKNMASFMIINGAIYCSINFYIDISRGEPLSQKFDRRSYYCFPY